MPDQVREKAGAVDMQPVPFASDAQARFICMLQPAGAQPVSNPLHCWGEPLGGGLDPRQHRRLRDLTGTQIREEFADPRQGH